MITDCLDEVCFAVACLSVDEQWIVRKPRSLEHCLCGGVCELIKGANDEGIEGVAWIEVVALIYIERLQIERGVFGRLWARRTTFTRWSGTVHDVFDGADVAVEVAQDVENEFVVLFGEPFFDDLRWHRHLHARGVAIGDVGVTKPGAKRCF